MFYVIQLRKHYINGLNIKNAMCKLNGQLVNTKFNRIFMYVKLHTMIFEIETHKDYTNCPKLDSYELTVTYRILGIKVYQTKPKTIMVKQSQ